MRLLPVLVGGILLSHLAVAQQKVPLLVSGVSSGLPKLEDAAKKDAAKLRGKLSNTNFFEMPDSAARFVLVAELSADESLIFERFAITATLKDTESGILISSMPPCTYTPVGEVGLNQCIDSIFRKVVERREEMSRLWTKSLNQVELDRRRKDEDRAVENQRLTAMAAKTRDHITTENAARARADGERAQIEMQIAERQQQDSLRQQEIAAETARQMAIVNVRFDSLSGDAQAELEFWDRMAGDLERQGGHLRSEIRRLLVSISSAMQQIQQARDSNDYNAAFQLMGEVEKKLSDLNNFK